MFSASAAGLQPVDSMRGRAHRRIETEVELGERLSGCAVASSWGGTTIVTPLRRLSRSITSSILHATSLLTASCVVVVVVRTVALVPGTDQRCPLRTWTDVSPWGTVRNMPRCRSLSTRQRGIIDIEAQAPIRLIRAMDANISPRLDRATYTTQHAHHRTIITGLKSMTPVVVGAPQHTSPQTPGSQGSDFRVSVIHRAQSDRRTARLGTTSSSSNSSSSGTRPEARIRPDCSGAAESAGPWRRTRGSEAVRGEVAAVLPAARDLYSVGAAKPRVFVCTRVHWEAGPELAPVLLLWHAAVGWGAGRSCEREGEATATRSGERGAGRDAALGVSCAEIVVSDCSLGG
ncbi:hypothetical protein C8Q76DRAFT_179681 [Earliella scabrosa]|nr:hypothetical protein C8Q76DRAFT_179681 [Earliella scabrosa]